MAPSYSVPGILLPAGTHAARPAANAVPQGALYSESDTSLIYQSDGSTTWTLWATLTASSILTTKGDLAGYDTAPNRIPVGTDGYVLTADSAQALGLKWSAPATGSDTYSDHIKTHSDLVAYWRLNEAAGSTSFADYKGGAALTSSQAFAGGPSLVRDSTGKSVGLYTTAAVLSRAAVTLARPYTLEAWGVLSTGGQVLAGQWNGSGAMFYSVGQSDVRGYTSGSYGTWASTISNHSGRHYLALTVDAGGTSAFYVDGAQIGTTFAGGTDFPAGTAFQAGSYNTTTTSNGPIVVSDIALYNTALSSSEITTHWNNGK